MDAWLKLSVFATLAGVSQTGFGQRDRDNGPAERCESTTCFNQLAIRNVEVVSDTSLIVYVGAQECPFLVEMTGTFCDLTFLPGYRVVFRPSSSRRTRTAGIVGGPGSAADGGGPIEQTRVCATDIGLGIERDPFTSTIGSPDSNPLANPAPGTDDFRDLSCIIQDVRSLTDDERLELYVDSEFAPPPPPFGTGRVEAPENPAEPTATPDDEDDDRSRRRRRRDREENEN